MPRPVPARLLREAESLADQARSFRSVGLNFIAKVSERRLALLQKEIEFYSSRDSRP